MTGTSPIPKASNDKCKAILETMRQRIVAGEWSPGSQLPIRAELERAFGVSSMTMQKALDQLSRDGFTYGKRRWGTFVVDNPPHLSRYGLVFPNRPGVSPELRFWTALINVATNVPRSPARQMPVFYGVDDHADSEDYQRLLGDVRHHRLAGLIFPSFPFHLTDTPILLEPSLSRVAIMPGPVEGHDVTALVLDGRSFIDQALEYFAKRGRRRIAVLGAPGQQELFAEYLHEGLAPRRMKTQPYWLHEVSQFVAQGAQACVHLLLRGRPEERPDGLIIADDNLVEYGVAGAMAAGVQLGKDADVVAHCNFPWPPLQGVAIKRLGYDARQLLELGIEIIDRQRRGEGSPASVRVPAVFEEMLSDSAADRAAASACGERCSRVRL